MKGMSITTAAGGALSESRASRFTKAATRAAGRCLHEGTRVSKRSVQCEVDVRGTEENLSQTEEPRAVLEV